MFFDDVTVRAWEKLGELGVSDETLQVVTSINGYSLSTLEDVLYVTEGYQSFAQLDDWEDEDEDEDEDEAEED